MLAADHGEGFSLPALPSQLALRALIPCPLFSRTDNERESEGGPKRREVGGEAESAPKLVPEDFGQKLNFASD